MEKKYSHQGFETLSKGVLGNGGQNLYLSKKGVLQRIFNFDTTGNGCFDIMIANSHDYNEKPPLQVIARPASSSPDIREVLTDGSHTATIADINGDGFDDLVIGAKNNGHLTDLAAFAYYGGRSGITENHKIELSAPGCIDVACGDFNGDGLCDIAFIIEGGILRIYTQQLEGFLRNGYVDFPFDLTHIVVGDIDGDGYADLYCRIREGEWVVLWGGVDGILPERRTIVGIATDDAVFDTLPVSGGNLSYIEQARPKLLSLDGRMLLLYCGAEEAVLYDASGRNPLPAFTLSLRGVISAAAGDVDGDGHDDLVLLCRPAGGEETAIVLYGGERGFAVESAMHLPVKTPRDVVVCDFTGNGCGDIAVCQGRNEVRNTTESLLFVSEPGGICKEPRLFVTHNAVDVLAARTTGGEPELVFVNHSESDTYGHVPAYIYTGDKGGWSPDRRVELPGHSPGSLIPADFFDSGYPDILLFNNSEDQPENKAPSYIYRGGSGGIDPRNRIVVPTYLSWGGQVGDVNRDGYLDIIFTSAANNWPKLNRNTVTVLFGSEVGYSIENSQSVEFGPDEELMCLLWPCLADLNGDGWLDLVVPVSNRTYALILWGGPEGYSIERSQKLPIERPLTVRAADLNGNGYLDLVFGTRASNIRNKGHEGSVVIFWGGAEGYSTSRCCELPSYQCNNITIADLNNDGYLDIFVSSYFNSRERDVNSFIYWNDKGSFSVTNRKRIFAHSSSGSLACDLNGNGYVDLIVSNHRTYGNHRTDTAVWWNGPEGFKEERRLFLPCLGPHDMVGVDVGNIYNRGDEEYYTSPVVELDQGETVKHIGWEGDVPEKCWVHAQVRAADSYERLLILPFTGPEGTTGSFYENGQPLTGHIGRFVQYRLAIGAKSGIGTPRITSIYFEV